MSFDLDAQSALSANDRALINEAVRRVQTSKVSKGADSTDVLRAVTAAVKQGRRDLFGLVKAGTRVATNSAPTAF